MTCTVVRSECLRIGDTVPVVLDFSQVAANTWRRAALYDANARVRPSKDSGFEFEASAAGQSGAREPRWPNTLGATVTDGSITWTAKAVSTASLVKTLASVTWTVPSSFTVSGESVDAVKQLATAYLQPSVAGEFEVIAWATFSDAPSHVEGFAIAIEVK